MFFEVQNSEKVKEHFTVQYSRTTDMKLNLGKNR